MDQPKFTASDPLEVLRQVNLTPRLLEDFRPVAECLEWRLSQNHWHNTGTTSFTNSEVPYAITSSGTLSTQAARVLFANCIEAPPTGKILVLETGAGTGMFAKFFLDEFERLCSNSGHPFASQIVYYVTDGSLQAVEQWKRLGIFDGKSAVLGTAQGRNPLAITVDGKETQLNGLRAVFANYVIDSLDSAVLRRSPNGPEELHIRTHFSAQPETRRKHFDITLDQMQKMVSTAAPELLGFLDVLEFEAAFLPVSKPYPYMEEALAFGHDWPRVTLNFGAMEYLERVVEGLDSNGFVLVNDYGLTQPSESNALGCVQRFGPTAAMGINFPLLAHHFSSSGLRASRPASDERLPLHPMLLTLREVADTEMNFQETFGWECHRDMNAPSQLARQHLEAGRVEQAGRAYEQALQARPRDWSLMGEIAEFLLRHVEDYDAGRRMAETALSMNPWYSVWLWNLLGDALYALNRFSEAHEIYLKAQSLSADDIRTALNLGYTYWELGSPAQALQALARGLAADGSGQFRDRLLEKQSQILAGVSQSFGREQEWLARRTARMTAG